MKRIGLWVLIAAFAATFAGTASAGVRTSRVDRREARQQLRIQQGVRSGELSPGEAARLRAGERHIRRAEWRAKSDGVVTPRARVRLNRALNRESRRIYRLKHNAQ